MISLSNSHFLLGSLSSHFATNLKLCQSRTSGVRQTPPPSLAQERNVQDGRSPWGRAGLAGGSCRAPAAGAPALFSVKPARREQRSPRTLRRLPG